MPDLAELVTRALHGRQDELRAIVQQQVDERLAALVDELVVEELEARRVTVTTSFAGLPSSLPR